MCRVVLLFTFFMIIGLKIVFQILVYTGRYWFSNNVLFFFFNDTATTEIYTLSLHDALPISAVTGAQTTLDPQQMKAWTPNSRYGGHAFGLRDFAAFLAGREKILPWIAEYSPYARSEEHTSELQSRLHLVCRLLLEKKKKEKK